MKPPAGAFYGSYASNAAPLSSAQQIAASPAGGHGVKWNRATPLLDGVPVARPEKLYLMNEDHPS